MGLCEMKKYVVDVFGTGKEAAQIAAETYRAYCELFKSLYIKEEQEID
jgi:hypothetical protein